MQAELEKLPQWLDEWIDENSELGHDNKQWVVDEGCLRALLSRFVLCDSIAVDCHECSGDGWHWGRVNGANKRIGCPVCNETGKLYAPASPLGNAGIGKEGGE
jgi:hypothetical protein